MAGYFVGVDVGGTKVLAALVQDGQVLARSKADTPQDTPDNVLQVVAQAVRDAVAKGGATLDDVIAVGVGVPGVVGPSGECIWAPNAPLSDTPVAERLSRELGRPVAVGNDVNVGTLGEKTFGAARDYLNVFGMFVGTGIGGGLIVNGEIVIGEHNLGAEVGHILIDFEAAMRGDEGGGEFEYYASRLGMERQIAAAVAEGRETVLAQTVEDEERIRSGALRKAIEAEDAVVIEVMDRVCHILGIGAVTVIHLVDPEALVFGGGVVEANADYMMPRIQAAIEQHVAPGNGKPMRLLTAELGDDAVIMGAVALAQQRGSTPTVQADRPGRARVNDQGWDEDLVIGVDGRPRTRKAKFVGGKADKADRLRAKEIRRLCRNLPGRLIIGTGFDRHWQLSAKAEAWLHDQGIAYELLPTPDAAAAYNAASGRKALLMRVTR